MFELRMKILLSLMLTLCAAGIVTAAGLSDPMQPPKGLEKKVFMPGGQGDTKVSWVLQSVLLGSERAVAIIDGTLVSCGERYHGAKLLKVEADEVVLQNRKGKKIVLKLTPGIHKKMVSADTEKSLK